MRFWNTVAAELRKAVTLPGIWAGAAAGIVGSVAFTLLEAATVRGDLAAEEGDPTTNPSPFEAGSTAPIALLSVTAVVIGVIVISSEYAANSVDAGGGRQVSATLTAVPHRWGLLGAKMITVVVLVVGVAALTLPATVGVAHLVLGDLGIENVTAGDAVARSLRGVVYWILIGLIACAITVMTRSGVIVLTVLIVNNSVLSFSLLLTKLTPLAYWLPDAAGLKLFDNPYTMEGGRLDALSGGLVMGGWALILLVVAGVVFARRDA